MRCGVPERALDQPDRHGASKGVPRLRFRDSGSSRTDGVNDVAAVERAALEAVIQLPNEALVRPLTMVAAGVAGASLRGSATQMTRCASGDPIRGHCWA
jgi:hypothetical protein